MEYAKSKRYVKSDLIKDVLDFMATCAHHKTSLIMWQKQNYARVLLDGLNPKEPEWRVVLEEGFFTESLGFDFNKPVGIYLPQSGQVAQVKVIFKGKNHLILSRPDQVLYQKVILTPIVDLQLGNFDVEFFKNARHFKFKLMSVNENSFVFEIPPLVAKWFSFVGDQIQITHLAGNHFPVPWMGKVKELISSNGNRGRVKIDFSEPIEIKVHQFSQTKKSV